MDGFRQGTTAEPRPSGIRGGLEGVEGEAMKYACWPFAKPHGDVWTFSKGLVSPPVIKVVIKAWGLVNAGRWALLLVRTQGKEKKSRR